MGYSLTNIIDLVQEISAADSVALFQIFENDVSPVALCGPVKENKSYINSLISDIKDQKHLIFNEDYSPRIALKMNHKVCSFNTFESSFSPIKFFLIYLYKQKAEPLSKNSLKKLYLIIKDLLYTQNEESSAISPFAFFDNFDFGIMLTDKKGNRVFANKVLNGYFDQNQLVSRNNDITFFNELKEKQSFNKEILPEILTSPAEKTYKLIYLSKSKKEYNFLLTSKRVDDSTSGNIYIMMIFQDISTFVKKENFILETTKNIDSILYSSTLCGSKYFFISDALSRMLGFTKEEFETKKYFLLRRIDKKYFPGFKKFINDLRKGLNSIFEYPFLDKKGLLHYLRHSAIPIYENGQIVRVVGVINDITMQHKIRTELENAEEKFRILVETANDLIFNLNAYGYYVSVNSSGAVSMGYKTEDFIGRHFMDFIEEKNKSDIALAFQKILSSNEVVSFEAFFKDKYGKKVILEIQAQSLRVNNKLIGMVGFGRDITSRLNDENKLKDLNAKLVEANRIISIERDRAKQQLSVLEELNKLKNEFISNVSHELRTPLASIVGFAETIASDREMPAEMIYEFNDIILSEGKRLAKLINDVLDFSKLETVKDVLHKSEFNLAEVTLLAIESYTKAAEEKEIVITQEIPDSEVMMVGDKDRIAKVVSHLLSNAVKFTNQGGRITVSVQDFLEEVELIVSDTGIGIAEEELPKLFQKFHKVSRPGTQKPGAGFGLVVVKQIVDLHKGLLRVRSELNEGTTFIIRLPKKEGR